MDKPEMYEALYRAHRAVARLVDDELLELGLGYGLDRLLLAILKDERLDSTALARRLGLNRSTVSRQLRKLERIGAIELRRSCGIDRRMLVISRTKQGARLQKMLSDHPSSVDARLTADWSDEDRVRFVDRLVALRRTAERMAAYPF